jgi:hypothetical protein
LDQYFFNNTINEQRYIEQILQNVIQQLDENERNYGWFQHDGATAHTTQENLAFCDKFLETGLLVVLLIIRSQPVPLISLLVIFPFLATLKIMGRITTALLKLP